MSKSFEGFSEIDITNHELVWHCRRRFLVDVKSLGESFGALEVTKKILIEPTTLPLYTARLADESESSSHEPACAPRPRPAWLVQHTNDNTQLV